MHGFGAQSMVGTLRRVLVCRPGEAFGAADPDRWHYAARPELAAARREHDAFVARLQAAGVECVYQEDVPAGAADSLFTHDASLVSEAGAILLNMGKLLRRREPAAAGRTYVRLGIPLLGRLSGPARAEGGDLLWLDAATLVAGQGVRTNAAGVRALRALLRPLGVSVTVVPLPPPADAASCFHLMSVVSLVDRDLAVVYPPLLPADLGRLLDERGFRRVEVPDDECATMAANVLALGPRRCLMLEGNPRTRRALEASGCEVATYRGREISLKAEGGPTCLTRPLLRDA